MAAGAQAAMGVEVLGSDADTIQGLNGAFGTVVTGGGWGPYGAGEGFAGTDATNGDLVVGGGVNVGIGAGGGYFGGVTGTIVAPIGDMWDGEWEGF